MGKSPRGLGREVLLGGLMPVVFPGYRWPFIPQLLHLGMDEDTVRSWSRLRWHYMIELRQDYGAQGVERN